MPREVRPATLADLPALHAVIERAYRGDSARQGWTHEADLVTGTRTDLPTLQAIVADPAQALLTLFEGRTPLGCVNVADRGAGLAYLGLLCIEPSRQGDGLGRDLLAAAEGQARDCFGCASIEMTVLEQRSELIAYYERRGWRRTGERRPFPVPLDPPYVMEVLAKPLA
jgi:ribosomal protein S18 acetylase RimI-like enzyme